MFFFSQPPYISEPPTKALLMITTKPPPPLPNPEKWSPELKHFLNLCLQKDPSKRPQAIELLQVLKFFILFYKLYFFSTHFCNLHAQQKNLKNKFYLNIKKIRILVLYNR